MGKKKKKKGDTPGEMLVCTNSKAKHQYQIEERLEAGMVLRGSEVKSLRDRAADLSGSYAGVSSRRELFLYEMHIAPYEQAGRFNHAPKRPRKLLVHRRQIERLAGRISQQGYTLVPVRVYFREGRAKVELGLGKGIRQVDSRESIRRRIDLEEARRAMKRVKT
jgi:SsrA-binding protein